MNNPILSIFYISLRWLLYDGATITKLIITKCVIIIIFKDKNNEYFWRNILKSHCMGLELNLEYLTRLNDFGYPTISISM